jgi:hypothetical protein
MNTEEGFADAVSGAGETDPLLLWETGPRPPPPPPPLPRRRPYFVMLLVRHLAAPPPACLPAADPRVRSPATPWLLA